MIYLIGGAPRVGKSILCQQIAAKLRIGWISTDLLMGVLRVSDAHGIKSEWNAAPEAIATNAEWFLPYLEHFIWGVGSMAEGYVIEGVDFLPGQVRDLGSRYPIQAVFLGSSHMTLEILDHFPGHSPGYANLPEEIRHGIAKDIPAWSDFIRQEAARFSYPYVDMVNDFPQRLAEAESTLIARG